MLQAAPDPREGQRLMLMMALLLGVMTAWPMLFPAAPEVQAAEEPVAAAAPAQAAPTAPPAADAAPLPPERIVPAPLCGAVGEVRSTDGALHGVSLDGYHARYDVTPLYRYALQAFSGEPWRPYGEEPGPVTLLGSAAGGLIVGAGDLLSAPPPVYIDATADGMVTKGRTADGLEVERTVQRVAGDPCRVEVVATWRNVGSAPWSGRMWVGLYDVPHQAGAGSYETAMRPAVSVDGDLTTYPEVEDLAQPTDHPGRADWFGLMDTWFAVALTVGNADDADPGGLVVAGSRPMADGSMGVGASYVLQGALAPGEVRTARFGLYAGSKQRDVLGKVDDRLVNAVELGFFSFFALPLLWLLKVIHAGVGDWALAIVTLTFVVKAAFYRLTASSFVSAQAMQAIQPELERLRSTYKDNPEELNRQTMTLFRERGVNPVGGCLPMLVQMPVWIALYSVLLTSVELYHAKFLYIKDLTAVDPYMAMPAIVMALMILQQRMMPMSPTMDPAQQQMMKWMPIVFGLFFFNLPAGLVLYIFVNMLLSMAQQWYIKRTFNNTPTPSPAG